MGGKGILCTPSVRNNLFLRHISKLSIKKRTAFTILFTLYESSGLRGTLDVRLVRRLLQRS